MEYQISSVFLSTLQRQWAAIVDSLPSFRERLRYRMLLALATLGASLGPLLGRALRAHLMLPSFEAIRTLVSHSPALSSSGTARREPRDPRLLPIAEDHESVNHEHSEIYYGVKTAGD
jgi:hypothetical protein